MQGLVRGILTSEHLPYEVAGRATRARSINIKRSPELKALYVLGKPIAHSKSPVFQNAGLNAAGLPSVYERKEVNDTELAEVAKNVRNGNVLGCNITLPHKARAAQLADRRTAAVEATGVANTWWSEQGELWADNTDIVGLQMSFAALLDERDAERVVILGAGGAANAAIYALSPVVKHLTVVNRTLSKAVDSLEQAATWLPEDVETQALTWPATSADAGEANAAIEAADLVIQTTSIPILFPQDAGPFNALALDRIGGDTRGALLELAYGDEPTVPMRRARDSGARALDGATMLLHQGARSFERWLGLRPNMEAMRDALAESLGRDPDEIVAEIPEHIRERWGVGPREAACSFE